VSNSTARAGGSSSSRAIRRCVSIVPPRLFRYEASAEPVAEPKQRPRRNRKRPEEHALDLAPRIGERTDQPLVCELVPAEAGRRLRQALLEQDGAPVVERVSRRRVGVDPVDAELESPKKRRRERKRMDGRADVVDEARERQLGRAQATAELLVGLVNLDLQAGPRERDRSREPVRP